MSGGNKGRRIFGLGHSDGQCLDGKVEQLVGQRCVSTDGFPTCFPADSRFLFTGSGKAVGCEGYRAFG